MSGKNLFDSVNEFVQNAGKAVNDAAGATVGLFDKGRESIVNAVDANGSGEIDIEDFIIL